MNSAMEKRCSTGNRNRGYPLVAAVFLLFVNFLPDSTVATTVTWIPNLEWNTASNWADGFVPLNGTRVVFPVEMRLSVGLPARNSPLDIAGLELPRDGALALPETGTLTISDGGNKSGKTARWTLEGPLLWVDPDNWSSERSSSAVPHLERIPCRDDVVILPGSKRTVSIQLPNTPGSKVKAIRVQDDTGNLPPWEWRTQVQTQREFSSGPRKIGYSGIQSCVDCTCQLESVGREILTEVCNTRGASCPELECEYPVKVEGHCCLYCGGRVVLSDKTSVSLAKRLANLALGNYGSTLSWYARRTWDSKTEILIAGKDKYSEQKTTEGITTLTSTLAEQGIKVISIDTAGGEKLFSRWGAVVGPFFGTMLIVMVLLLVALPYWGYPLPQVFGESWRGFRELVNTTRTDALATVREPTLLHRKPFGFAKFENAPESEVELATTSSDVAVAGAGVQIEDDEDDEDEGARGGRFANPLYSSKRRQPEVQTFTALRRLHDEEADEEVDLTIE